MYEISTKMHPKEIKIFLGGKEAITYWKEGKKESKIWEAFLTFSRPRVSSFQNEIYQSPNLTKVINF